MTTRVLIVDDNVYLNHLLQNMLEEEGYEVEAARYAREGYSAYLRKRPHVVLTDIHMPGGTGLEMIKKIRRHDPEVRAIYMSGDWENLQSAMEKEKPKAFVKPLRKPFLQQELMKVLSECLSPAEEGFPEMADSSAEAANKLSPLLLRAPRGGASGGCKNPS